MTREMKRLIVMLAFFALILLIPLPGCKKENSNEWVMFEETCFCGNTLKGSYRTPCFWFECIDCGRTYSDKEYKDVEDYYKTVGFRSS